MEASFKQSFIPNADSIPFPARIIILASHPCSKHSNSRTEVEQIVWELSFSLFNMTVG